MVGAVKIFGGFFFVFGESLGLFECRDIWHCRDVYLFTFVIIVKRDEMEKFRKIKTSYNENIKNS